MAVCPGFRIAQADLWVEADAEAWKSCTNAYASTPQGRGKPLTEETLQRSVQGLRSHPTVLIYIAWDEASGEAAGSATVRAPGEGEPVGRRLTPPPPRAVLPGLGHVCGQAAVEPARPDCEDAVQRVRSSRVGCLRLVLTRRPHMLAGREWAGR